MNTAELSFFLFYQYTAFSSHAEDDCQMYSRGSVVGETSLIDPDILPTPPLIFTAGGGQKAHYLASFSTSLDFESPVFEIAEEIWNLKQTW